MENNLGSQKSCRGQAETVHAEVSFYNTPQYLKVTLEEELMPSPPCPVKAKIRTGCQMLFGK